MSIGQGIAIAAVAASAAAVWIFSPPGTVDGILLMWVTFFFILIIA